MRENDFDAIIVGGGPAGSTAGCYLAQAGLRVLVVEKERFPRFHIGESIMPVANTILREIGVWDKVDRAGFVPKYGAEFHVANKSALPKQVEFSKGLVPGLDYTFQVERSRFDQLLLDHARELGCEVRQETKATAVRPLGRDGYEVNLSPASGTDGEAATVRASWIIDATGRDTGFAKLIRTAPANPALAKRVAIYAHFHGVKRPAGKTGGNIVIIRNAHGWAWCIPLDGDRVSVGVVVTTEHLRSSRLKPEALFRQIVAESPKLAATLAGVDWETKYHVTADYNYRARRFRRPAPVAGGRCRVLSRPDVLHGRVPRPTFGQARHRGSDRRPSPGPGAFLVGAAALHASARRERWHAGADGARVLRRRQFLRLHGTQRATADGPGHQRTRGGPL